MIEDIMTLGFAGWLHDHWFQIIVWLVVIWLWCKVCAMLGRIFE